MSLWLLVLLVLHEKEKKGKEQKGNWSAKIDRRSITPFGLFITFLPLLFERRRRRRKSHELKIGFPFHVFIKNTHIHTQYFDGLHMLACSCPCMSSMFVFILLLSHYIWYISGRIIDNVVIPIIITNCLIIDNFLIVVWENM